MAEILFMLELDQGQIHQPMTYGSRGPHFLALSTFTENRMPHRDEASEGLKNYKKSSEALNQEKGKGQRGKCSNGIREKSIGLSHHSKQNVHTLKLAWRTRKENAIE